MIIKGNKNAISTNKGTNEVQEDTQIESQAEMTKYSDSRELIICGKSQPD